MLPLTLAKGELGKHYRLGWQEKHNAGQSLVTPDLEHQYNLPEGASYDYEGKGLEIKPVDDARKDGTPFNKSALDRLNQGIQK